jgi:flagellar FliL protein
MTDTATLAAAAPAAAPAKKSKMKMIVIVLVVLLAAGGGYYMFMGKSSAAAAPAAPPPPEPGHVLPLEPIYVNLAQGHFLKLGMALQGSKAAGEELDGSQALDVAIETFSGQDMETLADLEVRTELKQELVEKVTEAYEDEVIDVYFTEFVMQ